MKFWCHDQRELKAMLAKECDDHQADLTRLNERLAHYRKRSIESRRVNGRLTDDVCAMGSKINQVRQFCELASERGSHVPIRTVLNILDD